MKKLLALLLCLSLVFALAACSTPESQTQQPAEQPAQAEDQPTESTQAEQPSEPEALTYPIEQFTVGTTAAIETATFGEYNFDMLASGVSELPFVWQDAEGNYHPLLASYETADSVTWVYTIEPGMTWSDGKPVTAEDILFTLEYDDANGSANFVSQTDEDGKVTEAKYASYAISDDGMSISLTLSSANVRELSNMTSFRVMPKHIYEGRDSVTEAEARVTCGPYMLDSFNKEAGTLTFIPNPYYPLDTERRQAHLPAVWQRRYHVSLAPERRPGYDVGILHGRFRFVSGCAGCHRHADARSRHGGKRSGGAGVQQRKWAFCG